ncbi:hypothetical protein [Erythrobacter sp. SD-21]|uniref:hypothetical protein n=1 Tax=Erythrobacter sp. SD-21 TaxID=161528 RepID=UPI0012EA0408|nr:hypothetical protein [Erythrobacter sp. SD-21]
MNETVEYELQHAEDFFKVGRQGVKARADDREKGASIFLRLDDGARVDLIARILDNWLDGEELNHAMVSGALRHAWDSEPYTGGARVGSYVTSAAARLRDAWAFSMDEFIEEWGVSLMSDAEARELKAMAFPLTVYRGGTGTVDEVASGVSWTLDREVASFYANEWPRSWGAKGEPVIVSRSVDENEAFAFLNDRSEAEILIPYADHAENVSILEGAP